LLRDEKNGQEMGCLPTGHASRQQTDSQTIVAQYLFKKTCGTSSRQRENASTSRDGLNEKRAAEAAPFLVDATGMPVRIAEVRTFPSACFYDNQELMAKSISDNHKNSRRGRPRTCITPMTVVRLSAKLEDAIIGWAGKQDDQPTKAEAIRRLVQLGLASEGRKAKARR
jgi:hypothetical protein